MTMHTRTQPVTPAPNPGGRRVVAVGAAVLAALLVWTIAVPVLGLELTVAPGNADAAAQTVGPALVAAVSLLASLLGWALLATLERRTRRARTVWVGAAGVVLLASLAGPLSAATGLSATLTLLAMHLAVAVVLVPLLARTANVPDA